MSRLSNKKTKKFNKRKQLKRKNDEPILTTPQKIGIGVSIASIATSILLLSSKKTKSKKKSKFKKGITKETKSDELKKFESLFNPDKNGMINSDKIIQVYTLCTSPKLRTQADQPKITEQFYNSILNWNTKMCDPRGRRTIASFLLSYYRKKNTKFNVMSKNNIGIHKSLTNHDAQHIRYWIEYELNNKLSYVDFTSKFDYLFNIAFHQESIPHMKQLYNLLKDTPKYREYFKNDEAKLKEIDAKKSYRTACEFEVSSILGNWDNAVIVGDKIAKTNESKDDEQKQVSSSQNDFMYWTIKSLESPKLFPNYGTIYKIIDTIKDKFPINLSSPATFDTLNVYKFRYKFDESKHNIEEVNKYAYVRPDSKEDDGFYIFKPVRFLTQLNASVEQRNYIRLTGKLAQTLSPVIGQTGFIPVTGSWNDTMFYFETMWTSRSINRGLMQKHVIMEIIKTPKTMDITVDEGKDGKKEVNACIWKGFMKVILTPVNNNPKNLYDIKSNELDKTNSTSINFDLQLFINK